MDGAIERLEQRVRAGTARDRRHPPVWLFIRKNWRKVRRLVEREGLTFRAMAQELADEPEARGRDGQPPSEFSVRRAYLSVRAAMGEERRNPPPSRHAKPKLPAVLPPIRAVEVAGPPTATSDPQGRSGGRGGLAVTRTAPAGGRPAQAQKPDWRDED